jgi:hypothetical protein
MKFELLKKVELSLEQGVKYKRLAVKQSVRASLTSEFAHVKKSVEEGTNAAR